MSICTLYLFILVTDDSMKMCNPWETKDFLNYTEIIPDGTCSHCLPDCISTIYETEVSSAPFKPCDHTNLESSDMCILTNDWINPPLWAHNVKSQYEDVSTGHTV